MKRLLWCSALLLSLGLFGCGGGDTEPEGGGENVNGGGENSGGEQQAANDLDLKYVFPEFDIAVVAHPQRAWNSDLAKGITGKDELADKMLEETFIDPRKIERVLVLAKVPPPEVLNPPPGRAIGGDGKEDFRFDEPEKEDSGFEGDSEGDTSDFDAEAGEAERDGDASGFEAEAVEGEADEAGTFEGFDADGDDVPAQPFPGEAEHGVLDAPPDPEPPAIIIWMTEPVDSAKVLESTPLDAENAQMHGDTKIYVSGWSPETEPALAFPTDKTIFFGQVDVLKKLLDAKEPQAGPLADRLAKENLDVDLLVVGLLGQHDASVKAISEQAGGGLPPKAAEALDLATSVDSIVARVDLGGDDLVDLVVETESAEVAGKLVEQAKEGLKGLGELVKFFKNFAGEDPDALAMLGLAEKTIMGVTVESSDSTVHGTVAAPSDWAPVVTALNAAVAKAANAAKVAERKNMLRHLAIAFHNFHDTFGGFPAVAAFQDAEGKPLLSWRVALLPYFEEAVMYEEIAKDEAWDSETNKAFLERMPAIYKSPGVEEPGMTTVVAIVGDGTGLGPLPKEAPARADAPHTGIKFRDITDGTANTILVIRTTPDKAVPWTKPADVTFDKEKLGELVANSEGGAFMAIFADGSVQELDATIPADVLEKLLIRNDGEIVDYFDYAK